MKKLFYVLIFSLLTCQFCEGQVLASHKRLDPGSTCLTAGSNAQTGYFRYKYGLQHFDWLLTIGQKLDGKGGTTYGTGINFLLFSAAYDSVTIDTVINQNWGSDASQSQGDAIHYSFLRASQDRVLAMNVSPVLKISDARKTPVKFATVWILGANLPIPRSWYVQSEFNVGLIHTFSFPYAQHGKQTRIISSIDQLPICFTLKGPTSWPKLAFKLEDDLMHGYVTSGILYTFGGN